MYTNNSLSVVVVQTLHNLFRKLNVCTNHKAREDIHVQVMGAHRRKGGRKEGGKGGRREGREE